MYVLTVDVSLSSVYVVVRTPQKSQTKRQADQHTGYNEADYTRTNDATKTSIDVGNETSTAQTYTVHL